MLKDLAKAHLGDTSIAVRMPDGKLVHLGESDEPRHVLAFKDPASFTQVVLNPQLGFAEAYMNGGVAVERGDLLSLLLLLNAQARERALKPPPLTRRMRQAWMEAVRQANPRRASLKNVERHYDLTVPFYRLFLDPDMQYSCAYFARPDMSLAEAQRAKKHHIASKLMLEPGARVLDIGCGWGGMALTLARDYGARVDGITLSAQQCAHATLRAEAEGLDEQARFGLMDYRDVTGRYDRIVSVGMFEHVGKKNFLAYFQAVRRLLNEKGVALIHTIGRIGPPVPTTAFIDKYIFPGGYIPSLSDIAPAQERSGSVLCDLEVLRLHYAETVKAWRENFEANRAEAEKMYDARFCRMWELYLAGCEAGFRTGDLVVFQLQLAKRNNVTPITRDYITDTDRQAAPRSELQNVEHEHH